MKKIIFFLFLTLNVQAADFTSVRKEDCTNTDIRNHHPQLKGFFSKPRDQGSIAWCYGLVAADILSVEVSRPVSAFHMSSIFNKSLTSNDEEEKRYASLEGRVFSETYEYGFTDKALEAAVIQGEICPEEAMPFESKTKYDATAEMVLKLESLKANNDDNEYLKNEMQSVLPENVYGDNDYNEILRIIRGNNMNVSLEKMASYICRGKKIKNPPLRVKLFDKLNPNIEITESYLDILNQVLTKGRPVGIYYDTKYIVKNSFNHQSTIIGRKWQNNKCHYRIRNSWGNDTESYLPGTILDPEDHSIWVSDETLDKMSDHLTYLDPVLN